MTNHSVPAAAGEGPLPADDLSRTLTVADADGPHARPLSVVGDTYTILVSGADTQGRYCLIDMLVPDGGGPPPHRHDFEEAFMLLEGELAFTFRGKTQTVKAPTVVNIPANAPHQFKNVSGKTVHMLCQCTPAGQDEFFQAIGAPLANRQSPPPKLDLDEQQQAAKGELLQRLTAKYRTEILDKA